MKIVVCMKIVLDPEAPVSSFKVDLEANRVIPQKGTPPVLNPFDENALEAALRIKDSIGATIVVISMGRNLARPVIKKVLAVGADELIVLEDDIFENLDSNCSAHILANAVRKIGQYDLILCGRQAADTNSGTVGSGIAEILGIPSVIMARKIEVREENIRVQQLLPDGYQVIEMPMPSLVTVSNEIGKLRPYAMSAIIAAQKKKIAVWNSQDLEINPAQFIKMTVIKLYIPTRGDSRCEIVSGATPEDTGANLAIRLAEAQLIKKMADF